MYGVALTMDCSTALSTSTIGLDWIGRSGASGSQGSDTSIAHSDPAGHDDGDTAAAAPTATRLTHAHDRNVTVFKGNTPSANQLSGIWAKNAPSTIALGCLRTAAGDAVSVDLHATWQSGGTSRVGE